MQILGEAVERYSIPEGELQMLIDGVEMDSTTRSVTQTWEDLRGYCYLVASVVGRMCVRIFGFTDPVALDRADDLGLALQLTNILRDITEDAGDWSVSTCRRTSSRSSAFEEEALLRGDTGPGWQTSHRDADRACAQTTSTPAMKSRATSRGARRACVRTMAGIYEGTPEQNRARPVAAAASARSARAYGETACHGEIVAFQRIAVIGAGLAGLAAALELKEPARTSSSSNAAVCLADVRPRSKSTALKSTTDNTCFLPAAPHSSHSRAVPVWTTNSNCSRVSKRSFSPATERKGACAPRRCLRRFILLASFATTRT